MKKCAVILIMAVARLASTAAFAIGRAGGAPGGGGFLAASSAAPAAVDSGSGTKENHRLKPGYNPGDT